MEDVLCDDDKACDTSRLNNEEDECALAEFSCVDLQKCFEWRTFLDVVQADLLVSNGVSDDVLVRTHQDTKDGLACAVAVAHDGECPFIFATTAFETLTGLTSDKVIKNCWQSVLLPSDRVLNHRINREGIQEIEDFCLEVQESDMSAVRQMRKIRVLLFGGNKKEQLQWLIVEVAAVWFNGALHLCFILRMLALPNLEALEGCSPSAARQNAFNLFLKKLRSKLMKHGHIRKTAVVARILEEEAASWLRSGRGEETGMVRRNSLTRQSTTAVKAEKSALCGRRLFEFLNKSGESMLFAHNDFFSAHEHVDASDVLGAATAAPGKYVRNLDYDGAAWVVADATAPDFPLVHISKGFTQLTGYQSSQVLGKNCRFLQPLDRSKNEAINAAECKRLKDYCTLRQADSKIVAFLLNQDASGHFFWNLLVMLYVAVDHKTYILGTLTKLSSIGNELMSILIRLDTKSLDLVKSLRSAIMSKEIRFSPLPWHIQSNESVLEESVVGWMQECCQDVPELWEGEHFIPPVGGLSSRAFGDRWRSILKVVEESASKCSPVTATVSSKTDQNIGGGLCFCISDLKNFDCTLVFVSKEFEQMTGYDSDFALGRNSRFLFPNYRDFCGLLNGTEIERIRTFCEACKKQAVEKTEADALDTSSLVNLLIYERRGGERFWCLSRMSIVKISGHPYVIAVQLPLQCAMPFVLATRLDSVLSDDYDRTSVEDFTERLNFFLIELRAQLCKQDVESGLPDMRAHLEGSITRWASQTTDDFDGDHHVVKNGKPAVLSFAYGRKLSPLLSELAKNQDTASIAETIAANESNSVISYAVSDAAARGYPLVYVSKGFEELTGYNHEWALGRNCKFLQPKLACWNDAVNINERRVICKFVDLPPKKRHLTCLLINEARSGRIFSNILMLRHVSVDGHPYIFSMQTSLPKDLDVMCELLLGGSECIGKIDDLRNLIREREASHPVDSLQSLVDVCMKQWLQDVPVSHIMRLSIAPRELSKANIPPVGVELTRLSDLHLALPAAIEDGVRHFHFNFTTCSGDALQAQLFYLKIVDVLASLRQKCLHYLCTLTFSIRAKPGQEDVCMEFVASAQKAGVCIALWLLDASTANIADCLQSWQCLSRAQDSGEVVSLGIYGSSCNLHKVQKAVALKSEAWRISVLALDLSPATLFDSKVTCDQVLTSLQGETPVIIFGIYGHKHNLLHDRSFVAIAEEFDIDPCMVFLKWAEALGCLCIVPFLRTSSEAPNGFVPSTETIDPKAGVHSSFLADYNMVENSSQILGYITGLRPPELKSSLVWFGSVCVPNRLLSVVANQRAGKGFKIPSLTLPGKSDEDYDLDLVGTSATSRQRRRQSIGSTELHGTPSAISARNHVRRRSLEKNPPTQVRRRSVGTMNKLPSLEESTPTQSVVRRRMGNMSSIPSLEENRRMRSGSKTDPKTSTLDQQSEISYELERSTWHNDTCVGSAAGEADQVVVDSIMEEPQTNTTAVQACMGKKLPKIADALSDFVEFQADSVDVSASYASNVRAEATHAYSETSAPAHHCLRRRHSAETVADRMSDSEADVLQMQRRIRRWSTDALNVQEAQSGMKELQAATAGKVHTEPALMELATAKHGHESADDIMIANAERVKNEPIEDSDSSSLMHGLSGCSNKRISTRRSLLSGMLGHDVADSEDATPHVRTPGRPHHVEPLLLGTQKSDSKLCSSPVPPNQQGGCSLSLSNSLQAKREMITATDIATQAGGHNPQIRPEASHVAGFRVSQTSPNDPPSSDTICQEMAPNKPVADSVERKNSIRSRPLLPFGPQAPIAAPVNQGRRPSISRGSGAARLS